jgi:hypothetical protein
LHVSGECYFLFNTLRINTLSDTYNFYLRLLGTIPWPTRAIRMAMDKRANE